MSGHVRCDAEELCSADYPAAVDAQFSNLKKNTNESQKEISWTSANCKSRIFRMLLFSRISYAAAFVRKFHAYECDATVSFTLISAAVQKFHAYERFEVSSIRKFSAYKIFWIYSTFREWTLLLKWQLAHTWHGNNMHVRCIMRGTPRDPTQSTSCLTCRSIWRMTVPFYGLIFDSNAV